MQQANAISATAVRIDKAGPKAANLGPPQAYPRAGPSVGELLVPGMDPEVQGLLWPMSVAQIAVTLRARLHLHGSPGWRASASRDKLSQ